MAGTLDVEETSVGGGANLPQSGQVLQPSANGEVVGVVDDRLGPQGATQFVICLSGEGLPRRLQAKEVAS